MSAVCVDSGFLIGLYDEGDQHHERASRHFLDLFASTLNRMVVPWPTLYEAVSTRMTRHKRRMTTLERDWKRLRTEDRLELLDDLPFRDRAIDECFDELGNPPAHYRALSVSDRVIRNILADPNVRIDLFITFNVSDFADACKKLRRLIIS